LAPKSISKLESKETVGITSWKNFKNNIIAK